MELELLVSLRARCAVSPGQDVTRFFFGSGKKMRQGVTHAFVETLKAFDSHIETSKVPPEVSYRKTRSTIKSPAE